MVLACAHNRLSQDQPAEFHVSWWELYTTCSSYHEFMACLLRMEVTPGLPATGEVMLRHWMLWERRRPEGFFPVFLAQEMALCNSGIFFFFQPAVSVMWPDCYWDMTDERGSWVSKGRLTCTSFRIPQHSLLCQIHHTVYAVGKQGLNLLCTPVLENWPSCIP